MTNAIDIDPLHLDPVTRPLFKALLASTTDPLFKQGVYQMPLTTSFLPPGQNEIIIPVRLTRSLLVRPSKKNSAHKRVEIIGQRLGSGAHGMVYQSLGVLKEEFDMNFFPRNEDKARVIKSICLFDVDEKKIQAEAEKTKELSSILHCKSALFNHKFGFIVMRNAPGILLTQYINKLRFGEISPTARELIQLTRSLLEAVEEVHQKNYFHRDIKPDNIFVESGSSKITLLDFAFARKNNPQKPRSTSLKGTALYVAPELYDTHELSPRADSFAIGLAIAQLWGDTLLNDLGSLGNRELLQQRHELERFDNLFAGMELTEEVHDSIKQLIEGLTRFNPEKSIGLRDAMDICDELLKQDDLDYPLYSGVEESEEENGEEEAPKSPCFTKDYGEVDFYPEDNLEGCITSF